MRMRAPLSIVAKPYRKKLQYSWKAYMEAIMSAVKVFLSYAREDVSQVQQIKSFLASRGVDVWLDVDEIKGGEKWRAAIDQALLDTDFILICLSSRSVSKRGFVQRELRIALDALDEMLDSDIFLIPVRLDKCEIPPKLKDLQYIDLFTQDGGAKLVEALNTGITRRADDVNESDAYSSLPLSDALPASPNDVSTTYSSGEKETVDLSRLGGSSAIDFFNWRYFFKRW